MSFLHYKLMFNVRHAPHPGFLAFVTLTSRGSGFSVPDGGVGDMVVGSDEGVAVVPDGGASVVQMVE